MLRTFVLCLMGMVAFFTASAAVPVLKNAPETAGTAGIKVRPLQGGQVVQAVAPKAMFYRFHRGEEKWQETHFDVLEFWRAAQGGCRWKDRKGNELVVAALVAPLPGFEADHAKREDIEAKMSETVRIGDVDVSRLSLGGDLMAGHAHARDLIWPDAFMRRYHGGGTLERTIRHAVRCGITAIFAEREFMDVVRKSADEVGGKIAYFVNAATAEDVAAAVSYLLDAESTTGAIIPVDAGQHLMR